NYIVIEHQWDDSPYYSLYVHLSVVRVKTGQRVQRGEAVATMGYTGEGLNQARAHLHLELNLMFSRQFETWHDTFSKNDPNHHGIFNGLNLAGLDIARLYLALAKNAALTIPEFLAGEEIFYKVIIPDSRHFDLRQFYPWMLRGAPEGTGSAGWEVSFNSAGVPLKIAASKKTVREPELAFVRKGPGDYSYLTRGVVGGRSDSGFLTDSGKRQMCLLYFPD
ncbi:MAG TPA: M23 family metallopeptidase, partial [Chthoniobacterales bacterium]|nr:M23 family metallopeptidase [Chthoniobacterales bacterium]